MSTDVVEIGVRGEAAHEKVDEPAPAQIMFTDSGDEKEAKKPDEEEENSVIAAQRLRAQKAKERAEKAKESAVLAANLIKLQEVHADTPMPDADVP